MLMSFSYLQRILDIIKGTKLVWIPTGGANKTHKGVRYRNMRIVGGFGRLLAMGHCFRRLDIEFWVDYHGIMWRQC